LRWLDIPISVKLRPEGHQESAARMPARESAAR